MICSINMFKMHSNFLKANYASLVAFPLFCYHLPARAFVYNKAREKSIQGAVVLYNIYDVTTCVVLTVINKILRVTELVCVVVPQR